MECCWYIDNLCNSKNIGFVFVFSLYNDHNHLNPTCFLCQETLDTFNGTEFWYVDQGLVVADENNHNLQRALPHWRDDKWWLPIPKVPNEGLSKDCTKQLQHQRECINQILKAAVAINTQILSEMEIPELYFDALPKVVS